MSRFAQKKTSNFDGSEIDSYEHGFSYSTDSYAHIIKPGLNENVVKEISAIKNEPEWMLKLRLEAYKVFVAKPTPAWGGDLSKINYDEIRYYLRPADQAGKTWDEVPKEVKETFDKLGIPKAEREVLAGVKAQYDSEVVYGSLQNIWAKDGVIFLSMDEGLQQYPELVKEYFSKVIPFGDNKFSALNTATWSGGSFVYIPKGVHVKMPLQTYFRINAPNAGQFERTLIIVDEGASVHYIEGCFTAGTQIVTDQGLVAIEDITTESKVFTHTGTYKSVYHTQVRPYSGKLYSVTVTGQSSEVIEATEEHPFLVVKRKYKNDRNKKWDKKWLPVKDLRKGDYVCTPIDQTTVSQDEIKYEVPVGNGRHGWKLETLILPCNGHLFKLIGYYLAEGSISAGSYLNFSFNSSEREYIEEVKKLLFSVFGETKIREIHHEKNNGTNVVVSSVKMCRFFEQFGTHSSSKQISDWVMQEASEKQRSLIEAWFYGDGNYYSKVVKHGLKEMFRISTTSKTLALQGRMLLARLGIASSFNIQTKRGGNRLPMHNLVIGGEYMLPFGRIVKQPIQPKVWNKKRATYYHVDEKYFYAPIRKIESKQVDNIDVYNFSVTDDESYVAGGVAVHNCTAPSFSTGSLHAAVVEIYVKQGARCQYTTVQNWYKNVYNLVTKRAHVEAEGEMVWTDFNMGCLTKNAKLFVKEKGVIPINEVKTGDLVWSTDLNKLEPVLSKVLATKDMGIKKTYRLTTENGRVIEATGNHPFLALSNHGFKLGHTTLQWRKLEEISVGEKVAIVKGLPDLGKLKKFDFEFNKKQKSNKNMQNPTIPAESSDDLLWLLGLYIGDGYCEKGQNGVWSRTYFAVPPEKKARVKLEKILSELFSVRIKSKGICATVSSVVFTNFIQEIGMGGIARTKTIPDWIFDLPRTQQLAFIQGYLDSDGYVRASKEKNGVKYGQLIFASVNKTLLEDMKLLMIQTGLNPLNISTYSKFRTLYKNEWKNYTTHFLSLNLRDNWEKILEKKNTDSQIEFVKVKSIEELGEQRVYDLEIEETSNFIANGLVVHNSKLTMKYPGFVLAGRGAKGEALSMAMAGAGQHQDTGSKAIHLAPHTSSTIVAKSISKSGGRTSYRGLINVGPNAHHSKNTVICDALLLDGLSRSDTYPIDKIYNKQVEIQHEATVSKIGDDQLFYLMSRGVSEEQARKLIVNGFIDDLVRKLPLEYAVEMNRLIDHEMEGSIG